MPQTLPTFFEEARDAARGAWALVLGRQDAPRYFDFSTRGVIGSLIALVLAVGVSVFGPQLLGVPSPVGAAAMMTLLSVLLFAIQIGAAYLVLNLLGRLDGFLPYLVADNWVNFYVSLIGAVSIVLLGGSDVMLVAVGLLSIIVEINIARRIVTLAPMQIAIFIVAQVAAQLIGLLVLGGVILQAMGPLPPG
ncbi:hypothetical protein [Devosia sediminis]|uniref:Yip1 domain-containing protein n=1 Tax=Devosia sediminis TaxID=2798801 RepID=A0A934MK24_9HYPH|nr:hypothetical protein [Devosia sediminis]MBJ3784668.1 hypothetical protein [Devosia sediminis]